MTKTITHNGKTFRVDLYANGKVSMVDVLYISRGSFKSPVSMTKARRLWDNSMSKAQSKEVQAVIAIAQAA